MPRASTTLRRTAPSCCAWPFPPGRATSTASDEKSTASERRPFVRIVFPLETRSMIASARPSRGATSTDPVTSISSTSIPRSASSSRASREYTVAARWPRRSPSVRAGDSSGTAASSVQLPKPSRRTSSTSAPRSRTRSAPVMPHSTTPSCTYSGMSSARTRRASTGALRHGNASARSPGVSGPRPASSRRAMAGSRNLPLEGTAILRIVADAAARAGSRPRPA